MPNRTRLAVRIHQAGLSFARLLDIWRSADRLGYDGATLFDVLGAPALEPWTALTALTMRTQRIQAIPLVLANTYRHPAVLAKMAATLDAISGGRLVLGIGAGGGRSDHQAHAIPWQATKTRVAQLEDAVHIMRTLWSRKQGTFDSAHYGTVRGPGRPLPAQPAGPPILVGGHGERHLLPAAARVADLCNMEFDLAPEAWRQRRELLARHCDAAGRDPRDLRFTHNATVIVGETDDEVRAGIERYATSNGLSADEAARRLAHAVVGTPEVCIERLRSLQALDLEWVFLLFQDLPDTKMLSLFGERVLTALR